MEKVKVTVRELLEMLAKCDWDSECRAIEQNMHNCHQPIDKIYVKDLSHPIIAVAQSTQDGTIIVFGE